MQDTSKLEITVTVNSFEMSPSELKDIFIFQSPNMDQFSYSGGQLFVAKKICKSLGGDIVASSIPNLGNTFTATMKVYCVNKLIT